MCLIIKEELDTNYLWLIVLLFVFNCERGTERKQFMINIVTFFSISIISFIAC